MKKHKLNKKNNFIEGYYISKTSICDDLINFFNESNNTQIGVQGNQIVDKRTKDSTDLSLSINDIARYKILNSYFIELSKCLEMYKKKYKFCDKYSYYGLNELFNIQKYKPLQAYFGWHCEKAALPVAKRHLVFMTYLNDVKKGGETEWYYQKLKVKPEKGLTVIWPSEWTFTHRGIKAPKEDKYIITGWYVFKE